MSDSARESEGFLQRWSRRKGGIASAADEAPATAPESVATGTSAAANHHTAVPLVQALPASAAHEGAPSAPEPLPTLADVAALAPGADVGRFMQPGVEGAVRNAALKKLFSDPHFNVMDGLDTYIDDYGKPDPLPVEMLRRMHQSAALGLFETDVVNVSDPPAVEGKACPDGAASRPVAQSTTAPPPTGDTEPSAEDDPDLRLQPDDADRRPGAGAGPER